MSMLDELRGKAAHYAEQAERQKDKLVERAAEIKREYEEGQRKKTEDWVYKKEVELKELQQALRKREALIRKKEKKLTDQAVFRYLGFGFLLLVIVTLAFEEHLPSLQGGTLIPRSTFDKGKYYLVDSKRVCDNFINVVKRVGVDSVVYTKTEVDCGRREYRFLGESYESASSIKDPPSGSSTWTSLVPGSSKSDLVNFICK
jgi:hypothetical protein